jgi:methionine salvage enolase-phosphatase E1
MTEVNMQTAILIAIIGTILAIVLFLCFLYAFKTGLRLAKLVSENKPIPKLKTPVQAIQDYKTGKEAEKENRELKKEIDTIMNYNGDIPKDE